MSLATIDRWVATGARPATLDAVGAADTALALWDRALPPALGALLDMVDFDLIDDLRVDVTVGTPLAAALCDAGYPDAIAHALADDIAGLVRRHAALTGATRLTVRLEVVETDACRRFHADYVALRLLCTYRGPGTLWCAADRPDTVHAMATGAVGVFKGRMLLDPPTILHRSPPIAATGERRLVLAIDPATASAPNGTSG